MGNSEGAGGVEHSEMTRNLDLPRVRESVRAWLAEDIGRGDHTTNAIVPPAQTGRARVEARGGMVVAGLEAARLCFEEVGAHRLHWEPRVADGAHVQPGEVLAQLECDMRSILAAERTALNLLQRLSGVATLTARFVAAVEGTTTRVVDTRKTTPGLRMLEKYAVRAGGGSNHRFGLDDGILIKDNHVAAAGGVAEAVRRAQRAAPHGLKLEVEVEDLQGVDDAVAAGADAILLDNMTPEEVREAVARAGGKALLEVSGGINLDNVRSYAEAGVDLISVGALTHSAPAADVALEVEG